MFSRFKNTIKHEIKKEQESSYFLTRFVFLRLLGFIYFFAFVSLAVQVIPLIGENGLLPAHLFLEKLSANFPTTFDAFINFPTIFWFGISDTLLLACAVIGAILSFLLLIGFANVPLLFLLWSIYLSFVHVGQLWYGYGWEIQLLETGFLALFFVPLWNPKPFSRLQPSKTVILLFRWLTLRIMLGAGLIKIRRDSCWKDLTCLHYHYETQPIPNPFSRFIHFLPGWFHKLGVAWNHFVEIFVPFFVFFPRMIRIGSGIFIITFQLFLIVSGNLSFLNWLTILPALATLDDSFLKKFLPAYIVQKGEHAKNNVIKESSQRKIINLLLIIVIIFLSIPVVQNLFSEEQKMNTSFNNYHIVNTYGAFGSVGKIRHELVVQGTTEPILSENTLWKDYEFIAKPTNVNRQNVIIAPYQPRIDWQIWFAAFSHPNREPWLIHFVWKLLNNDKHALSLIQENPFEHEQPIFIRIELYKYSFSREKDAVWKREHVGTWLPPLSINSPGLKEFVTTNFS